MSHITAPNPSSLYGIGIAQAHFFSFGGNARAKATL